MDLYTTRQAPSSGLQIKVSAGGEKGPTPFLRAFSGAKTGPQKVKAHSAASNVVALFWSPKTDAKKEAVSQKEVAPTFLEHLSQKSWAQKSGHQKSGPRHLGPDIWAPELWAQISGPRILDRDIRAPERAGMRGGQEKKQQDYEKIRSE